MLRSLYSGVSGMRSFQTKMDVIANNIANVNTTGYKSSRASFQDMLSQTTASAQGPTTNRLGGVNAQQIGLGVRVGSIDMIMSGGAMQPTNRSLDFAIENEGFFVVTQGRVEGADFDRDDLKFDDLGENPYYTRDGAFFTDHDGNLVNANGYRVLGYMHDKPVKIEDGKDEGNFKEISSIKIPNKIEDKYELEDFSVDGSGVIVAVYSDGNRYEIGQLAMGKFANKEGLMKVGNNLYEESNNSGKVQAGKSNEKGFGSIRQGFLEMSNVDLANEFTEMIVTSRAYQANSRSITTSDEMLQELINLKR